MSNRPRTLPLSPNLRSDSNVKISTIRLKFSRRDSLAYIAHLDMLRLFERAVMRSGIDCNYSQGFNPRPEMSFALPLGVGVETIDDYVDIEICGNANPVEIVEKLNSVLPMGVRILEGVAIPSESKSLMAKIKCADYVFLYPNIGRLLSHIAIIPKLNVTKSSKGKTRTLNIKEYILVIYSPDANSLKVTVKAGSSDNLRPDLFLKAIVGIDGFTEINALDTLIIRTGTYADFGDGNLISPIAVPGAMRQ